jgi:hypothetical protein
VTNPKNNPVSSPTPIPGVGGKTPTRVEQLARYITSRIGHGVRWPGVPQQPTQPVTGGPSLVAGQPVEDALDGTRGLFVMSLADGQVPPPCVGPA